MGIFTTLKKLSGETQQQASEAYQDLVRVSADDGKYDTDKAVQVIKEADRNFDQFTTDVDRMVQRIADAKALHVALAEIADYGPAQQRSGELDTEAEVEIDAIHNKYQKIREEERLGERLLETRHSRFMNTKFEVAKRLRETADPAIEAEIEDLNTRLHEHEQHCKSLRKKIELRGHGIQDLERQLSRVGSRSEARELEAKLDIFKTRQQQLQAELRKAQTTEQQALRDKLEALFEKQLVP